VHRCYRPFCDLSGLSNKSHEAGAWLTASCRHHQINPVAQTREQLLAMSANSCTAHLIPARLDYGMRAVYPTCFVRTPYKPYGCCSRADALCHPWIARGYRAVIGVLGLQNYTHYILLNHHIMIDVNIDREAWRRLWMRGDEMKRCRLGASVEKLPRPLWAMRQARGTGPGKGV
jgi:hypothetical protein